MREEKRRIPRPVWPISGQGWQGLRGLVTTKPGRGHKSAAIGLKSGGNRRKGHKMDVIDLQHDATQLSALATLAGLAEDTIVLTAQGEMRVQDLRPGMRIITRDGFRRLAAVDRQVFSGTAVRISPSALGHDRPDCEATLGAAQQIFLRDWRAEALYAAPTARVAAARLADGEYIRLIEVEDLALYTLSFAAPCVIYAAGLELAASL